MLRSISLNGMKVGGAIMIFGATLEAFKFMFTSELFHAIGAYIFLCLLSLILYFVRNKTSEYYRFTGLVSVLPLSLLFDDSFTRLVIGVAFLIGAGYLIFFWRPITPEVIEQ